nr:MAG TPA: hypothetical protein [Microviridae sp.]
MILLFIYLLPIRAFGYMKFSPDLFKAVDHCQHRFDFIVYLFIAYSGFWLYEIFS